MGVAPETYLTAEGDDALIMQAVIQRATTEHVERRTREIEAIGKTVAQEVAKMLG